METARCSACDFPQHGAILNSSLHDVAQAGEDLSAFDFKKRRNLSRSDLSFKRF